MFIDEKKLFNDPNYINSLIKDFFSSNAFEKALILNEFSMVIENYEGIIPNQIKECYDIMEVYDPRKPENEFLYSQDELDSLENEDNEDNLKNFDDDEDDDYELDSFDEDNDYEFTSVNENKRTYSEAEQENTYNNLKNLIGIDELKNYADELYAMKPLLNKLRKENHYPTEHLLFAIDRGCGTTTILKCFYDFIKTNKLHKLNNILYDSFSFCEETYIYGEGSYVDRDSKEEDIENKIYINQPGVSAIHIEEWVDKMETPQFVKFMHFCAKKRYNNIFIFIVPNLDEGHLERVYRRLNDLLNVKLMKFSPYTDEQLLKVAKYNLSRLNLEWNTESDGCFRTMLNQERSDGCFYGMKTVEKITTEIALAKAKKNGIYAKNNSICSALSLSSEIHTILPEDFEELLIDNGLDAGISGYEEFDKLIGLEKVKNRIEEIVVSIKSQQYLYENGLEEKKPCYHMMFTGNPGTGKTVVARIVGKIFSENKLLPVGDVLEATRFDMVAENIGQTGPKTVNLCKSAMGSVLFIDEAYLLAAGNGDGSNKDFGAEALGALIAEMENNRDKFVVIMAGYEDDMEELYKMNAGLRQRIPHRIHFDNYTREQLFEIFKLNLKEGFEYDDEFLECSKKYFLNLKKEILESKEFGNARFVRNLVERVRMKAIMRAEFSDVSQITSIKLIPVDLETAVSDKDIAALNKNKSNNRRIGF